MKSWLFIFTFCLTLSFSFCQSFEQLIDEKQSHCDSLFDKSTIDRVRRTLDKFENYLFDSKILLDKSGNSYRNLYLKIIQEKNVKFIDPPANLSDSLWETEGLNPCLYKILSEEERNNLQPYHFDSILSFEDKFNATYENLNVFEQLQLIVDSYPPHFFEINFFKYHSLLVICMLADSPEIFEIESYNESLKKFETEDYEEVLEIVIDKNDSILVDNIFISNDELRKSVSKLTNNISKKRKIVIMASRQTSYSKYLIIYDLCKEIICSVRNKISNDKFNSSLEDLSDSQSKEILTLVPNLMHIKEPNRL